MRVLSAAESADTASAARGDDFNNRNPEDMQPGDEIAPVDPAKLGGREAVPVPR